MKRKKIWVAFQYISLPFLTMVLILYWLDDILGVWIIVLLCWIFIPAFIISVISFIGGLKCNTRHQRRLLIGHLANISIFIMYFLIEAPNRRCDAYIMEEHYRKNCECMDKLYYSLYNQLRPGYGIDIEFKKGDISIFHIIKEKDVRWNSHWNPNEEEIDFLLYQVGLDKNDLNYIKKELKDMHCISVKMCAHPNSPFIIGFRRIGMGEYLYRIYPTALSSDELKEINEDCSLIPYLSNVIFEYGGGAIGNQCFPNKEQYLNNKMSH